MTKWFKKTIKARQLQGYKRTVNSLSSLVKSLPLSKRSLLLFFLANISLPIQANSLQSKISPRQKDEQRPSLPQIKRLFKSTPLQKLGPMRFNSGNPKKQLQMMALAYQHEIEVESMTTTDLKEIESDALRVIVHKASQFPAKVIVADSSLDVQGAKVGVNLKWMISKLDRFIGKRATLTTLLAYKSREQNKEYILVFRGQREGKLIHPRGPHQKGSPLNRYFLPAGSQKTLAEKGGRELDPTNIAFKDMVQGKAFKVHTPLKDWQGPWQKES